VRRTVQIQTSTMCTARCKICPWSTSMLAKQRAVMADEVFSKIMSRLQDEHVEVPKLPLYMQNEPFTDSKYLDRLEYVLRNIQTGYVEVSTNCSLLSKPVAKRLAQLGSLGKLVVVLSFQGTTRKAFQDMTGLDYTKVIHNIRAFLEAIQGGGPSAVIHAYGDPQRIGEFWQDKCTAWNLVNWPRIKPIAYTNRAGNLKGEYAYKVDNNKVKKCIRHDQWLHFNWKGDVIICCNDYENEVVFGNVMDDTLETITGRIPKIIQKLSKDNPKFICRRCDAKCIGQ